MERPNGVEARRARDVAALGSAWLRADLAFDAQACALISKGRPLPLTAREGALLAALLTSPHRYLSAETLAARMTRPGGYAVDAHSIEQTICGLRRKLGESARRPRVLLTKRGLGYGIFPEQPKPAKTAPKTTKR